MTSFLDLQNGFYNAISQVLGYPPGSPFQLLQPYGDLPSKTTNQTLWAYFNNIPPHVLTQIYEESGGNQFFSDYKGLLSALVPPVSTTTFQTDVGETCFKAWVSYIQGLATQPPVQQWPQMFRNWAMLRFPSVATVGASDLAAIILDPVSAAQLTLVTYGAPDWSLGYSDLVSQLGNAPNMKFSASTSNMDFSTKSDWAQSSTEGLFGLWANSSSSSSQSSTFAASAVTLNGSFAHVTTFAAVPGLWYNSAAMGEAFSAQSGPPWNPKANINWQNTFGVNGNMNQFAGNIVVVSGINFTVTSSAVYSKTDQATITQNESAGLWPFYSTSSSSGQSAASFDQKTGQMTIQITSQPGVPIVLGCGVLPVNEYLGHALEGARIFASALRRLKAA
jgi:hypothetical protein